VALTLIQRIDLSLFASPLRKTREEARISYCAAHPRRVQLDFLAGFGDGRFRCLETDFGVSSVAEWLFG